MAVDVEDATSVGADGEHGQDPARIEHGVSGLVVHRHRAEGHQRQVATVNTRGEASHMLRPVHDLLGCLRLAAAVGGPGGVVGQQLQQGRLILRLHRLDQTLQQARTRFGADLHARPRVADALARTADDLPARGLALAEDARDVVVAGIENLVQQKSGTLLGREPLEQGEKGHRQIRRQLAGVIGGRRRFQRQRLGQPWARLPFAIGAQLPQPIDAQARGGRDQPGFGRADFAARVIPAQPGLLHDVLRLGP